jgi:hypothetical protein
MTDEWLERNGRGLLEVLSQVFVWRFKENHENVRIYGILVEIWTEHLPNASQDHNRYGNTFYSFILKYSKTWL